MRKSNPDAVASDPDIDEKRRARRRLLGAAALALVAALGLPLLLDSEPRKPPQELLVEIQPYDSQSGVRPGEVPGAPVATETPSANAAPIVTAQPDAAPPTPSAVEAKPAPAAPTPKAPKSTPVEATASKLKPAESNAKAPEAKSAAPTVKAPESKPAGSAASASSGVFAVQIGAFASESGAADQVARARKAGLKAYTERIRTGQGVRIRVRVGPYPDREAAEKARTRLKAAGIESAIIAP